MRRLNFFFILLTLPTSVAAQQQSLGIFGLWGAFRDDGRCYAISEPVRARAEQGQRPFVAVGHRPGAGGGQLHVRLGREKRQGSAVLVRIDGRSFQLIGAGRDAWAPDAAADAEIQSAMRTGVDLHVESRSVRGTRFREEYRLSGAATAMDAAAIGCLPRRG